MSMMGDTIAAIATAPGESSIGIVRMSGAQAKSVLQEIFVDSRGRKRQKFAPRRLYLGYIVDLEGRRLDQVLAVYMPGPFSYTGEDVVEINAHGGALVMREVLALLLSHGVRLAEPGEFTQRAFLAGKMDLMQAEAVMDLIGAKSRAALGQAERHLRGELSVQVQNIREGITAMLAQIAASIDFPEHDLPEVTNKNLRQGIAAAEQAVVTLLETSFAGRVLREGLHVSIVGRPNVGKSALLNALVGRQRAIVTEIAGTTRDVIEDYIAIDGIPVKLVDTAGLRTTDDPVEKIGVVLAEQAVQEADLLLVVLDQSSPMTEEDEYVLRHTADRERLILLNKSDLAPQWQVSDIALLSNVEPLQLSAITGDGIAELKQAIADLVLGGIVQQESAFVANARQERLLRKALGNLQEAAATLDMGWPLDMVGTDLHAAYDSLGAMLGLTVSDDLINEIFSRFCIGK